MGYFVGLMFSLILELPNPSGEINPRRGGQQTLKTLNPQSLKHILKNLVSEPKTLGTFPITATVLILF